MKSTDDEAIRAALRDHYASVATGTPTEDPHPRRKAEQGAVRHLVVAAEALLLR
jgi:hypothetical protein